MDQSSELQSSEVQPTRIDRTLLGSISVLVFLWLTYFVLGWFDTSTELTPSHDDVLQYCLGIAVIVGVLSGAIVYLKSKRNVIWRRIVVSLAVILLGFLSIFMPAFRIADVVEGLIDFPSGSTKSYPAFLMVSRAYHTSGKGQSWNIQTTPFWSNLSITKADYEFMLAHRRPGDTSRDEDEISSHGFFCARVTVEQAGNALRVMHAGSNRLPEGTVIVCPSSVNRSPAE